MALFSNSILKYKKSPTAQPKTEITKTDKEIDSMVYKLYDLTDDEIKIVEGI
jgi:type II restriction/modification system DNA methylase subunit YeeA